MCEELRGLKDKATHKRMWHGRRTSETPKIPQANENPGMSQINE
jgi:hypothetical protein